MRARRIDTTARDLTAYAKSRGFKVHTVNGTIDALIWHPAMGRLVAVVDFKSKGGTLTPDQAKLLASGWPVRFVSDTDQVDALAKECGL